MRLLVTRPRAEAERTVARIEAARARGVDRAGADDRAGRRCRIRSGFLRRDRHDQWQCGPRTRRASVAGSGARASACRRRRTDRAGRARRRIFRCGFGGRRRGRSARACPRPLGAGRRGFFISPAATARAISRRSSPPSGIDSRDRGRLRADARRPLARRCRTGDPRAASSTACCIIPVAARSSFSIAPMPAGCAPRSRCCTHYCLSRARRGAACGKTIQAHRGRAASR